MYLFYRYIKLFLFIYYQGTNSEQSDMDLRITNLQKQLEAKKLESIRLKSEQKKLRLENLKVKEQDLLKEIELYDKKIEESKKSLMVEIKRKNVQIKSSLKPNSKNSSSSILQNIINYNNDDTLDNINEHLNKTSRKIPTNNEEYDHIIVISSQERQPVCKIQQTLDSLSKDNIISCTENCASKNLINFTTQNKIPSLETNRVNDNFLILHKKSTVTDDNTLKELCDIQTEANKIIFNSPVSKTLIHTLQNIDESNNLDVPENSISIKDIPNMPRNDNNLYFENNIEKSTTYDHSINYSNTNMSLSDNNKNNIKKIVFVDDSKKDNEEYEKNKNCFEQTNILNNGIEVDNDYSLDFTSDESSSEFQEFYEFNKNDDNNMIDLLDMEQSNESSYEEERSEGDVMFEDKTFIEHYSNNNNLVRKKS